MVSKWIVPIATSLLIANPAAAGQATMKPVASVAQLMEALIIPSSDVIFQVAGEAPRNAEEWAKVRNSAVMLAESGNLLMIGARARDNDAWMKMSRALVDAAAVALQGAEAKDAQAIAKAGDTLIETCSACHDRYLTPSR